MEKHGNEYIFNNLWNSIIYIHISNKKYNYQFRYIHADIGENGDTKDMVKEVVGLIRGNGFEPKIKPEAYVATAVADRYT